MTEAAQGVKRGEGAQTPLGHEAAHPSEHLPSSGLQPDCPREGRPAASTVLLGGFSESSLPLNIASCSLPE